MGSGGAEDGPHARPLAVKARWRLWQAVWFGFSIVIAVSFATAGGVTGDGPGRGVDHSDPSAVHLRMAHVAVRGLCPGVENLIPQDGVGSGGLTRLWTPEDQQPALRRVSTPGVPW